MGKILNDDIVKVILDLKSKNYQRPQIKSFLIKNKIVDKIGESTISRALKNKIKKASQ